MAAAGWVYRFAYIAPETTVSVLSRGWKDDQAVAYSAVVYAGTYVRRPGTNDIPLGEPVGNIHFSCAEVIRLADDGVGRRFVIHNLDRDYSCAVDVLYLAESLIKLLPSPPGWPPRWPPQQASTELITPHKKESSVPTGTAHIWHDPAGEILAIGRPMTETLKCVPGSGNAELTVVVDVDGGQIADLPISHVVDVASRTLVGRAALAGRNQED
jgi:hypothetical protein